MLPVSQQIEYRQAVTVDDDRLAIDGARSGGQRGYCFRDQRETIGEVIAVAGE
jgi:hypothetical protein